MSTKAASTADAEVNAAPGASPVKREPPAESADERWTRRMILLCFWAVVILLGLPLWVWTTTVYRADLPVDVMKRWSDGHACRLTYPLHIVASKRGASEDQLKTLSRDLFDQLNTHGPPFLYYYQVSTEEIWSNTDLEVDFSSTKDAQPSATLSSHGRHLDVRCSDTSPACLAFAALQVKAVFADEEAVVRHLLAESAYSNQVPITNTSIDSSELEQRAIRSFKYASTYHLTFSLLTASATPSSWDIGPALRQYLSPLLASLSTISNFTVDTQVQLFSSISPSIAAPQYDAATSSWQLQRSDLSGFVNAAEWPLSPSINGGATINFILYVPPPDITPLIVTSSSRNSWIIPQWGAVQILNRSPGDGDIVGTLDLENIMYTFADQLTALIGLPSHPAPLQLRIDGLARERLTSLILSASSTLGALDKLTKKLQSIAIPRSVLKSVDSTVAHLGQACRELNAGHFQSALEHARTAEEAAEHAFFEPSMVGQVYFPDEHKVAVYVPLLGPMAVPLLMATLKEIREWRKRKAKTA